MYMFVLMLLSSLLCLWMGIHLLRMRKHDVVLFRLCEVRRELMTILRDRGFNLPKNEYLAARLILSAANSAIQNYNHSKMFLFNCRAFVKYLRIYKEEITSVTKKVPAPKDEEILEISSKFNYAMAKGFLAYTPFIRSEIGLMVLVFLFRFLVRAGVKTLQKQFEDLVWAREHIRCLRESPC